MNKINLRIVKTGAIGAAAGALLLITMLAVGAPAADGLGILGQPANPGVYTTMLLEHGTNLVKVMTIDNIFVLAYTIALLGAAALMWDNLRLFGSVGMIFTLLLALSDLSENALTVQLARTASNGIPITEGQIAWLGIIEQIKFGSATAAVVILAVGIWAVMPRPYRLVRIVVGLFMLFPIANAIAVVNPSAKIVLFGWMFIILVAASILLWKAKIE